MTIKVLKTESNDKPVNTDLIIITIERNRDRVRTIGNMLLTLSGVMISACTAFLIYFSTNKSNLKIYIQFFILSLVLFLSSAGATIVSSFLRKNYSINSEFEFVVDLLEIFNSELKMIKISSLFLFIGFLVFIVAAIFMATR